MFTHLIKCAIIGSINATKITLLSFFDYAVNTAKGNKDGR